MSQNYTMWGSSNTISFTPGQAERVEQLAQIWNPRPLAWRFFFAATCLSGPFASTSGPITTYVDFDVLLGVGRSQFTQPGLQGEPGFVRFVFETAAELATVPGKQIWTSTALSPPLDRRFAANGAPRVEMDSFVSQDITCRVRVLSTGVAASAEPMVIEAHAYFAPNAYPL